MERICQTCRLYNPREGVCGVTVIMEGDKYDLPVLPYDECHWERIDKEIQEDLKRAIKAEKIPQIKARLEAELEESIRVKQIRMWSDGTNGYIETDDDMPVGI